MKYKMASQTKRDPLSRYFKDLNDSDLDSDESSEEESESRYSRPCESLNTSQNSTAGKIEKTSSSGAGPISSSSSNFQTPTQAKKSIAKLPSAHECLTSKSSPEFLKLNMKQEVNWDRSIKSLEDDGASALIDYKSNAVPPPSSYDPLTDPGIKVVDSQGRRKRENQADDQPEDASNPKKAYTVEEQDV